MNPQSKFKISSWTWNNFVTSKLGFETQWTITCFELRSDSPNQCTLRTYWTPFRKSCKYTLQKYHSLIETTYPKIATNFQSLYLAEIFALFLWNRSWWLRIYWQGRYRHIFDQYFQLMQELEWYLPLDSFNALVLSQVPKTLFNSHISDGYLKLDHKSLSKSLLAAAALESSMA